MNRKRSQNRSTSSAFAIAVGLVFGFGTARGVGDGPAPSGQGIGRRALLVGVTRYDHLPRAYHLQGPANDVQLMKRLLMERYEFSKVGIVCLSEDEGVPERRPIRANIEREFLRLAKQASEGDQVVVLLSGHGSRQPESIPPDPEYPEPDGIDEIFLPADVDVWKGFPQRVPRAIVDNELGTWLRAIAARRAYVWAIFDCCHSGTMTRGTELVRELPPGMLVPREELDQARERTARRQGKTGARPSVKLRPSSRRSQPTTWSRSTPAGRTSRRPRARNLKEPRMPSITGCSPTHW